ncbi:MAG: hypothetical protein AAGA00_06525 [Pseudomonadota bacterium]
MIRVKGCNRKLTGRPRGLAVVAATLLVSSLMSVPGNADAPFEFQHPVANQVYDTLPIPLRINRKTDTGVPETEAVNVLFEIRHLPHPYGFVSEMWNAILPGKTSHETQLPYFWTLAPGTYSIRARADGFKDHPVEVSFTTTFNLERPLYRMIGPDSRVYQGAKVPLVVDWDPFWATVPHRPYGTLYAEVERRDEDEQAWRPDWKSGNLAGFELPVVLPKQLSIELDAPGRPTARRIRVRASFSRKAYTLPSEWRYFCHAPEGKVTVNSPPSAKDNNPCLGVSVSAGSAADP